MTEPMISVIVPTSGRPTLSRTLASIAPQLRPGDEIIVVRDDSGDSGDTPRADAMRRARGTHLAFLDDDDVYVPDGLEKMRRFARANPGRIGIFKMEHYDGTTHWREGEPVLRYSNVSTQNFLIPNVPEKLGRWQKQAQPESPDKTHAGDYVFLNETIALQGREPMFVDEVTVYFRPARLMRRAWARARRATSIRTRLRRKRDRLIRKARAAR
jgi:glycosyltransferase involved in cell wall biosynthesis